MSKYKDIYEEIKNTIPLVDEVEKSGVHISRSGSHRMRCCCPLHEERTPSFMIYLNGDYQTFYCWGCVEENEPILTNNGFVPIKDVSVGDFVLGVDGKFSPVTEKTSKGIKEVFDIRLGSSRIPLKLTEDHVCFFVKEEDIVANTPYIRKEKYDNRIRFSSRLKGHKRSSKYKDKLKIVEGTLDLVNSGDYFLYPVGVDRKDVVFCCFSYIREYTKGPRVPRISKISVNENVAWLMGIYLAEGSTDKRSVIFSLSNKEIDKCEKIQKILNLEFDLDSTLKIRTERSLAEVICSKKDLVDIFSNLFGSGVYNKKIPFEFFNAHKNIQKSLINGYLDGDGNYGKTSSVTVSDKLAYSIFSIAIQCEMNPHMSERDGYIDKNGIFHGKTYWITFRQRESLKGFYDTVGGVNYYFSKVISKEVFGKRNTYDLGVSGSSSFTTKNCVVHNCKESGDVISFVQKLKKISMAETIDYFKKNYKLVFSEEQRPINKIFSNEIKRSERANRDITYNYSFDISEEVRKYLRDIDNPDKEFVRISRYLKDIDESVHEGNLVKLKFHRKHLFAYLNRGKK